MDNDPIATWSRIRREFCEYSPTLPAIKEWHRGVLPPMASTSSIPILVKKMDVLDAALSLLEHQHQHQHPLVLIFADAFQPGGCVWAGAGMQDESLFRRTALFKHLVPALYPIGPLEAIYAPDVALGSSINGDKLSFVACAAPKMPPIGPDGRLLSDDEDLFVKKIELVFEIAMHHGHRSLVLGAWGCGAFGCPPRHVAEMFRKVIDRLPASEFDRIVFAVPGANYNFFSEGLLHSLLE